MGVSQVAGAGMMTNLRLRGRGLWMRMCPAEWKWWWAVWVVVVSLQLGGPPSAAHAQSAPASHVLIVTGTAGEPRFAEAFAQSARTIRDAALGTGTVPAANVRVLSGSASMRDADGRATREVLQAELQALVARSSAGDAVAIVLIGHGSAGDAPRFNLTGPDVDASEFALWLRPLQGRRLTVVIAASASGEWIPALAAPGRVVMSATKTAFERNESIFHSYFAAAFRDAAGDADHDGRVSMLEAFQYANREVERSYEADGRLRTENAVLDDVGDGKGSSAPSATDDHGRLAARVFLGADPAASRAMAHPQADSLLRRRAQVEQAIDALRARRSELGTAEYERQLEALITELAEIRRRLEPPETGP